MRRRATPEDEERRLAERVWMEAKEVIKDRGTYLKFMDEEFLENGIETEKQREFINRAFDIIAEDHPKVIKENVFEQAGGKDLTRDQKKTSKTIVITKEEYIRRGAQRVDLKGYDTEQVLARIKRKIVYAKPEMITIKGKKVQRYRDSKGRFASIKKISQGGTK